VRFRTWIVAALGLGGLLVLILVSLLASSRKAQEIYTQLDLLNAHHQNVDATLRRLRSDVNLSGIFVRDYLLDVARERAPEYREQIAEFRERNKATVTELLVLDESHAERIHNLEGQLYRTCVYRAVQEALTNCVRHAKARAISVMVTRQDDQLEVAVADDGVGFDSARIGTGLGLHGIEERVRELHGTMTIGNVEGGGTKLAIRLPWPAASAEVSLARAAR
jgi:signal transduction histidine kinase